MWRRSEAHFLNSDLQGSPKFTRAPKSTRATHHGRITKGCSKLVRHVLVEVAHSHARFAPGSRLSQFYQRISAKRGASKAAVATAAKMTRVMHQMLKGGSEFQP